VITEPNSYLYDELEPGHVEEFTVALDQSKMDAFRQITGDLNPLHTDDDFARSVAEGNTGRVAYGMLTASFLSTLAGMYMPGKRSLIYSIELKFARPVFPPDTLTIRGELVEKEEKFRLLKLKASVLNGTGEKVLRGIMNVGVMDL
jgi:3-hydroxybutyryl-CoA dehydratase